MDMLRGLDVAADALQEWPAVARQDGIADDSVTTGGARDVGCLRSRCAPHGDGVPRRRHRRRCVPERAFAYVSTCWPVRSALMAWSQRRHECTLPRNVVRGGLRATPEMSSEACARRRPTFGPDEALAEAKSWPRPGANLRLYSV